jgi:hypothetical protein
MNEKYTSIQPVLSALTAVATTVLIQRYALFDLRGCGQQSTS